MKPGSALALLAGIAGIASIAGITSEDPFTAGARLREHRRCPKCGGKAIWHETTAYCTKPRCGWFEVVKPAQPRRWDGVFRHPYVLTCTECGRAIMPGEPFYSDIKSGHLVRHAECHDQAEADDSAT